MAGPVRIVSFRGVQAGGKAVTFWADRTPSAAETGAHLTGTYSPQEAAISYLSFAVSALSGVALTEADGARVGALIEKLSAILR